MTHRNVIFSIAAFLLCFSGCSKTNLRSSLHQDLPTVEKQSRLLAVYEPWFGHPRHINVGYSTQDPAVIRKQIDEAKSLGISGFVIDWYGDREPFLDQSYALIQKIAGEKNFQVAMMWDEIGDDNLATEDSLNGLEKFHEKYLSSDAPGRDAYLTYNGRPVIFIFPKSGKTDWNQVRERVNQWNPAPLLIYEDRNTGKNSTDFDGYYAWVNPGKKGWAPDGSNWGQDYLQGFYRRMQNMYPNKIAVGGAWAGFNDSRASWSLGRYMSQRCGETFTDTLKMSREYASDHPLPFVLVETWNDYEEGTAIERGLAKCGSDHVPAGQ